jgi:RHS repeat-associated protein
MLETPEGARWRYTYNSFGRRVGKLLLGAPDRRRVDYLWQGQALAEAWHRRDGDGDGGPSTRIERWHFEPDGVRPLAREAVVADGRDLANAARDSEWLVVVADQIGTPTALFDTGGAQRWKCDATLWGRARTARDLIRARSEDEPARDQPSCALRFPGQWEDAESGLHYNLNRYYDPDTGQYLSPDPIGVDGGLRTHAYVHNPLAWMDPLGLAECNWGQWFARKTGSLPPAEMPRPHAHHIVSKGPFVNNPPMQSALTRSRNVLSKYGIDRSTTTTL